MKKEIWTKENLIKLYQSICEKEKRQITKKEWNFRDDTPSDIPIRTKFRTWNKFVELCGFTPQISSY